MAKRDFAFGKENFILIAVAVAVIIVGFMLMSGGGSGDTTSNFDRVRPDDCRNPEKQQR